QPGACRAILSRLEIPTHPTEVVHCARQLIRVSALRGGLEEKVHAQEKSAEFVFRDFFGFVPPLPTSEGKARRLAGGILDLRIEEEIKKARGVLKTVLA